MDKIGSLVFVLHAHLPFIRHPEHEFFLEEDWFFEAMTETYIPIFLLCERLKIDGINPNLAISFSPPLCAMMEDELLRSRYRRYLERLAELAGKETDRNHHHPLLADSAWMYLKHFHDCLRVLDHFKSDLLEPFRKLQEDGAIEIMTSTATHGLLPLMIHPEGIQAQIKVAAQEYRRRFRRAPAGLWLGECAFDPRVGRTLAQEGFKFFFMDEHGLNFARPKPRYATFAPVRTPEGVFAFGRDLETAKQVWSSVEGYPGDPNYREFYRDLGYDADYEYIRPYLHPDGVRRNVGLKYHRVTGKVDLSAKEPYDPHAALRMAQRHAEHFLGRLTEQANRLQAQLKIKPIIVSPYDAELYGHWWFEGPAFIEALVRLAASERSSIEIRTPSAILQEYEQAPRGSYPAQETIKPEMSSWGDKGYFEVWLNQSNDWIYPHLHAATEKMIESAKRFGNGDGRAPDALQTRALNQCAREVLLAQSSDWPFMMTVGSHVPYAHKRLKLHVLNFLKLHDQIQEDRIDETFVSGLESSHNIFPDLDFRVFSGMGGMQ